MESNTIKSNIEIILLDEIRVGDYPELAYPIYYEDDYRKAWSPLYDFSFTITHHEQQRVWGRFRFTAKADPSEPTQPTVRQITEGVFENVPIVEIK